MKLALPPRIGPAAFNVALKAFAGVVGAGWVTAADADRDAYADSFAPGPAAEWPASAAVAPASVEEVRALVRLANQHQLPLWPVARGRNLGYGGAAPRLAGSVVLDLRRMNRIHAIDSDLATCVIEPGVSFFDLYDEIERRKAPLWLSVPGNASGSVLGNALDHGTGTTSHGFHAGNLCGMEVVLPDGDLLRTGLGAMADNPAWHLYPVGYGPGWDLAFTQSSLGVVTRAGLWLQPAPAASLELVFDIPAADDIGWVVDTIAPMQLSGLVEQQILVSSWLSQLVHKGQRHDFWDKPTAIPEWRVKELLARYRVGYWQMGLRLYGEDEVIRAKAKIVKAAMARHLAVPPAENWWHAGEPRDPFAASMGVPSTVPLKLVDWIGGRGGQLAFSPVVPATSAHVLGQMHRARAIFAAHDVDFQPSFMLGGRFAHATNTLLFNRDRPGQIATTRRLHTALIAETAQAGHGEHRTHLGWMDAVGETYGFNGHAMRRFNERVKDALDPAGIIAPGKQGVWPDAYSDEAEAERA